MYIVVAVLVVTIICAQDDVWQALKQFSAKSEKRIQRIEPKAGSLWRDMEDRENDWLARQIRSERIVQSESDMLALKKEHALHCDARMVEH